MYLLYTHALDGAKTRKSTTYVCSQTEALKYENKQAVLARIDYTMVLYKELIIDNIPYHYPVPVSGSRTKAS